MAVRDVTMVDNNNRVQVITWADLDVGDTGKPVDMSKYAEWAVQQTAGAGAVTMEGSNDGTVWGALGSGVVATSALTLILERPLYVRPSAAGAANNTVIIVASGFRG